MTRIMASLAALAFAATLPGAVRAAEKGTRFWNLTSTVVTHLELAPAGSSAFGPDQCRNDPDGTVDPDERLKVTGVESGRYDVRIAFKGGKVCTIHGVSVDKGKIFDIESKALTDCAK